MGGPAIAVIGAGPAGIEAALAARERGWEVTVFEAARQPAGNVRRWGHVRLFTPWSMNISPRFAAALRAAGHEVPGGPGCPTGDEFCDRVLDRVAETPPLAGRVRLGTRVRAIGREGLVKDDEIGSPARAARPFRLLVDGPGGESIVRADAVIDAGGVSGNPNSLGDGGIPAPGETALAGRIERSIPDPGNDPVPWAGRRTLVVGAGHSAQTAARGLAELARRAPGTEVLWVTRAPDPGWDAVDDDPLPERAALVAAARRLAGGGSPALTLLAGRVVESLGERDGRLAVTLRGAGAETVEVDRVVSLTGAVGDHTVYRQLQVHECYATCGPMTLAAVLIGAGEADCLAQPDTGPDALATPEPGFLILGEKSHGRYGAYLMQTGVAQVDQAMGLIDLALTAALR